MDRAVSASVYLGWMRVNHTSGSVRRTQRQTSRGMTAVVLTVVLLVACHNPASVTITFDNQTSESLFASIAGRGKFEIEPNSNHTVAEYISGVDQDDISVVITTHDGRVILDIRRSKSELEAEPITIDASMISEE